MQEDILASSARPCSFRANIAHRRINRYGLAQGPTFVVCRVETKLETQQVSGFEERKNGEKFKVGRCDILAKKQKRDSGLAPNHRPDIRPLSQKSKARKLKPNPDPTDDIETYQSWHNLATIHFPDKQISP